MADRDGLGDLPLFDTEVRPVREFVAQEQRQEDDYQYITRMYSALARQILDLIEDICDQMEYEGSRMFDEYMDRTMLLTMVDKIYDKIDHQEKQDCQKKEQLLYQMILSLLGGEIYHRRCRYRRKRNMFKSIKKKEPGEILVFSCFIGNHYEIRCKMKNIHLKHFLKRLYSYTKTDKMYIIRLHGIRKRRK